MKCDVCDYEYDETRAKYRLEHNIVHTAFVKAVKEFSVKAGRTYTPRSAAERDALAKKSFQLLSHLDFASQVRGSFCMIQRNFDRSLHAAILGEYHMQHPTFEDYLPMVASHIIQIPNDVRAHFHEEYGSHRGDIAPGYAHWYPKGSAEREKQFEDYQRYDRANKREYVRPLSLLQQLDRAQLKLHS